MIAIDINTPSGAYISDCSKYRYALWRNWNRELPKCAFIMLNPSTADSANDDATITRCIKRAKSLNYGGIVVANLFAYRTTYPAELLACNDPVGDENDKYLMYIAANAKIIICAWGNDGGHLGRNQVVLKMLSKEGISVFNLGLTKAGNPLHPVARGKTRCIPYPQLPYLWPVA